MAPLVRTGGSRHTGLAAPPHRNIHTLSIRIVRVDTGDVKMNQKHSKEYKSIGQTIKKALSVNLLLLFVLSQGVYLGIRCYLKNRLGTKQYW